MLLCFLVPSHRNSHFSSAPCTPTGLFTSYFSRADWVCMWTVQAKGRVFEPSRLPVTPEWHKEVDSAVRPSLPSLQPWGGLYLQVPIPMSWGCRNSSGPDATDLHFWPQRALCRLSFAPAVCPAFSVTEPHLSPLLISSFSPACGQWADRDRSLQMRSWRH